MALPVAAIVSIVFGVWALLVLIIFAIYQFLKKRGSCNCECAPCGKENSGGCSDCCISLSETCDCDCCKPSTDSCLDSCCPKNKKISCVDIILCQCCAGPGEQPCCLKLFPCCESCSCCSCDCCPDCDSITCCCLEVRLVSKTDSLRDSSTSKPLTLAAAAPTDKPPPRKEIMVKSQEEVTPPQTPATARSISQLELLSASTNSYKKPAVVRNKKRPTSSSDSRSQTARSMNNNKKNRTVKQGKVLTNDKSGSLSPRSPLRNVTDKENIGSKPTAAKNKRRLEGELIEVPVKQNIRQLPIISNLSPYQMQNSSSHQMYSNQTLSQGGVIFDSSSGMSELSYSFGSSGFPSSRPLPIPTTYG